MIRMSPTGAEVPVTEALADAGRVGGFFLLGTGPAGPGWRPWRDLLLDEESLLGHVERVRTALGGPDRVPERVAASILVQSLAARTVSAPLATAAMHGVTPVLTPESLWWRVDETGWALRLPAPAGVRLDGAAPLAGVFEDVLAPLVVGVRRRVPVSRRVLHGNVAAALAGAKRVLGAARPRLAGAVAELTRDALRHPMLTGTGVLEPPAGPDVGWSFRRRSCCLYYRVPGGGTCADCVLVR